MDDIDVPDWVMDVFEKEVEHNGEIYCIDTIIRSKDCKWLFYGYTSELHEIMFTEQDIKRILQ